MLKELRASLIGEGGDTLIEVTFALAILGFVLLGSTAVAAMAFRVGQTARERTTVSEQAQEQMEALRSFRDNSLAMSGGWGAFQAGAGGCSGGGYCGVVNVPKGQCHFDGSIRCFHMAQSGGANNQWVPVSNSLTYPAGGLTVPTSVVEIAIVPPANPTSQQCAYDFELHYSFTPIGGGIDDANRIQTRLVNLNYTPVGGVSVCPNP
ncbi:MAG TPA: hypothetical protein VGH44_03955 [Candidatus Saccharimonadia bacterium]|jgi:type II secretory pathway pseudopilin PulG